MRALLDSDLGEREQMLDAWFGQSQLAALSTFCIRTCSLAVRENSTDLILVGLTAQVLEGYRIDFRDGGIQALAVAHHTAVKLGVDPREPFEKAAIPANPSMAENLREFLTRTDLPEILTIMRYREAEDTDGFRYEWMGWPKLPGSPRG